MNQEHQTQIESHKIVQHEDEIELIDILRVIWKWKYFILAGTIACGLIAAIISFNMTKVYSVEMILRPGILQVDERGRNVYIDSPENIEALIESGTFQEKILAHLKSAKESQIPKKLNLKVSIPKKSDTIKVNYQASNTEQGIDILNQLNRLLLETYGQLVQYFKKDYDMKMRSLKSETDSQKNLIQSYKKNITNLEKRIEELRIEIKLIGNHTNSLIKERDKLLSKNLKDDDILPVLLYKNTIQQNIELSNKYKTEINDHDIRKEEKIQKIVIYESEITKKLNEIESLQFKKDSIQNIQIIQPPTASVHPLKPKIKLNIILSLAGGFFFFLFSSFFLEYLKRQKNT